MSNEHPDMSGSGCDDRYYNEDELCEHEEIAFIAGARQMREMLARFVEQGGSDIEEKIAISIRANWKPSWGDDPGKPDDVHDQYRNALP